MKGNDPATGCVNVGHCSSFYEAGDSRPITPTVVLLGNAGPPENHHRPDYEIRSLATFAPIRHIQEVGLAGTRPVQLPLGPCVFGRGDVPCILTRAATMRMGRRLTARYVSAGRSRLRCELSLGAGRNIWWPQSMRSASSSIAKFSAEDHRIVDEASWNERLDAKVPGFHVRRWYNESRVKRL